MRDLSFSSLKDVFSEKERCFEFETVLIEPESATTAIYRATITAESRFREYTGGKSDTLRIFPCTTGMDDMIRAYLKLEGDIKEGLRP
ncbi:hypothetical protein ABH15_09015 [Methanoculleus taiwanensis]|uniref:Uncharacterized protein n=1 Tax=Methanoculleus taiwanensis TaxID=1550565 RepID=A0A498H1P1_9EURY|nr:hypothetical protein [Methanoculleus taiwanensis]RXE56265.1 hypothetical protein ABH15_09015 [Methanoculleus taiwanensis]